MKKCAKKEQQTSDSEGEDVNISDEEDTLYSYVEEEEDNIYETNDVHLLMLDWSEFKMLQMAMTPDDLTKYYLQSCLHAVQNWTTFSKTIQKLT